MVELVDLLPELLTGTLLPVRLHGVMTGVATEPSSEVLPERLRCTAETPALLTVASYNGTLAAVRTLGRAGIGVTIADRNPLAMSGWSRYTSHRVQCPRVRDTGRFIDWLLEFGRRAGRHVLLATSDDTAWLYALYRPELSQYFHVSSPSIAMVHRILNKGALYADAVEAGLEVPRTWFPDGPDDLERCGREARFPVVIKPRTQVLFRTQSKGIYVENVADLHRRYLEFAREPFEPKLLEIDRHAGQPMVQEYHQEAATGIYSISGYAHQGRLCGVRAARKLLQQPRRLGIGLCFEEAPLDPPLVEGLARLMARLRYSGVFETEFIQTATRTVLIDFNPRFYNQMAFDIARGMPLPLLAYFDALGDRARFDALCEGVSMRAPTRGRVFVDLISLQVMLSAQRLSGVLSRQEREHWASWHDAHRDRCTYPVLDAADRLPAVFAGAQIALRCARHPRSFIRSIFINKP